MSVCERYLEAAQSIWVQANKCFAECPHKDACPCPISRQNLLPWDNDYLLETEEHISYDMAALSPYRKKGGRECRPYHLLMMTHIYFKSAVAGMDASDIKLRKRTA